MQVIKYIVFILSIILIYPIADSFIKVIQSLSFENNGWKTFLIGCVVMIPIWFFILRKNYFINTFEHELTHLIVGLFFFKRPAGFVVTENEGGATYLYGGNFFIKLAPYYLPIFSIFIIPIILIVDQRFHLTLIGLLGFITAYHILSTIQEFSYKQPDIQESGYLFATVFLIFANLLIYSCIIIFVSTGFNGVIGYFSNIYSTLINCGEYCYSKII
jgi:hypothetical protein